MSGSLPPSSNQSKTPSQVTETYKDWQIKKDTDKGTIKFSKQVQLNGRTFKVTVGYDIADILKGKTEDKLDEAIKSVIDFIDQSHIFENQIAPMMKDAPPGERLIIKYNPNEGATVTRRWSDASKKKEETFNLDTVETKDEKYSRFERSKELADILRSNFIKIRDRISRDQNKEEVEMEDNKNASKSVKRVESPITEENKIQTDLLANQYDEPQTERDEFEDL